jgi:nicotinate-nucleotide--dimethylbenzimidazole phosphoribosyltransferase
MTGFSSLDDVRQLCLQLPAPDMEAVAAVRARQAQLTKPAGSLGRLETLVAWLAAWQRREMPVLERVEVVIFAGNHGVTACGVSPFPASVTAQMVANFAAGGAAINQLARVVGAQLRVVPLSLDRPTRNFVEAEAMDAAEFLDAVRIGYESVEPGTDLFCPGEMGIGNTSAAAAVAGALFGGVESWAGRGTGLNDAGLARKRQLIAAALAQHAAVRDPLEILRVFGGRELAAILGAVLSARHKGVPVLLDGFVCSAAVAPLAKLSQSALDHTQAGHVSAEASHRRLLQTLRLEPLLDLGMRLGEGSGAAVAIGVLRAALACHTGMATFAEAGVEP